MEQEETKTTAAAGVEMPPEAESWVQLHESELTELMQKQAKAAITELKRQEKQERKKEKYHNTFTLMKCYRDAVFHIENAISDGQQLELKGMTDEQQRTYLESIRRTRFKTLIMTAHIDKAIEEIERRREAAGRGVEYKAFEMYFMQGMRAALRISSTSEKITEEINDCIAACKADMKNDGVKVIKETDGLIIRAITLYCKAEFG